MADTNFRGPVNSMGSLEVQAGNTATIEPLDGPGIFYQGVTLADPRDVPFAKDGFRPGQQNAFLATDFIAIDAVPQLAGTTTLAAAQVITSGVPMSLATVGVAGFSAGAASIAVGVPIIPQGTTVATTVIALDFGFTTGTTAANSSTVVVPNNALFSLGQWIIIGNVGNSAATRSLVAQVQSIATANTTTITVSPVAATTLANVPIGQGNLYGSAQLPLATQFGPAAASASAHAFGGGIQAGLAAVMNPREMLARNISVAGQTTSTASILITGFDVWGQAMSELITINATAVVTSVVGNKAFKYVLAAVPQTTFSTNYQLGFGDVFGFPFRADEPEQLAISAGGTAVVNSVGIATAVLSAANNTSGDVRGTVNLAGLSTAASTSNNVRRLYVVQTLLPANVIAATPNNLTPMFGTTQA